MRGEPTTAPLPERRRSPLHRSGSLALLATIAAVTFAGGPVSAQVGIRPADHRPEPPPIGEPQAAPEVEVADPAQAQVELAAPALTIAPRGFEVVGCSAFDEQELTEILEPWVGRPVSSSDLLDLVDSIRRRYREAGFTTTEVVLPDQDLEDGVVRIRVVEGRVNGIEILGAHHYRERFFRSRLERVTRAPLDVPKLVRRLEQLQEEPGIERISALLEEQDVGVHRLRVEIREQTPVSLGLQFSNHRSPSIGSLGGIVELGHASLFGWSDRFSIAGQFSEGLLDLQLGASVPVTPWETRVGIAYRISRAEIVEASFADLDIVGRYQSVSIGLRQPLAFGPDWRVGLELLADWREASTTIFGRAACFEENLADCMPSAAILRLRQELAWRRRTSALAARSTISIGLGSLGATPELEESGRDGEFVSWLAQLQWAQLLPPIPPLPWLDGSQLLFRGDLQLASEPLLSFEQVAVGGAHTVRGYRQNQIVRDDAAIVSLELRLPLWKSGFDRPIVELAPFVDYGAGWDAEASGRSDESLTSAGLALRVSPIPSLRAGLSWAHRFRDDLIEGDTLQGDGIYFEVSWNVP